MLNRKSNFLLICVLMLLAILTRFAFLLSDNHAWLANFSAVGAVAMFGGYYLKQWRSVVIPLAVLWLSDLVLNNVFYAQYYEGFQWLGNLWVYGAFVAIALVIPFVMPRINLKSWFSGSLVGAILFFVITNLGVWMTSGMYPINAQGLVACFVKAIPFFRNTLISNLLFSAILFGVYEWQKRSIRQGEKKAVPSTIKL